MIYWVGLINLVAAVYWVATDRVLVGALFLLAFSICYASMKARS
jgi:hypothetical protein